jgi:hypothetical protein
VIGRVAIAGITPSASAIAVVRLRTLSDEDGLRSNQMAPTQNQSAPKARGVIEFLSGAM